jgi:hypothetical protein
LTAFVDGTSLTNDDSSVFEVARVQRGGEETEEEGRKKTRSAVKGERLSDSESDTAAETSSTSQFSSIVRSGGKREGKLTELTGLASLSLSSPLALSLSHAVDSSSPLPRSPSTLEL